MAWKTWLWRSLLLILIGVMLSLGFLVGDRLLKRSQGDREWAAARADTEAHDPNWDWTRLNESRDVPPAAKNSAVLIPQIMARLPSTWYRDRQILPWEPRTPPLAPNQRLPNGVLATARKVLGPADSAVELARTLEHFPLGNRLVELAPNVLGTSLKETTDTPTVAALLHWDTVIAIDQRNRPQVAANLLALLNASRSIGDEPLMLSQVLRMRTREMARKATEWTLAQLELPADQLEPIQLAWTADAEEPLFLYGIRGDRAAQDILFQNWMNGKFNKSSLAPLGKIGGEAIPGPGEDNSGNWLDQWFGSPGVQNERAYFHRWITQAVEVAQLPVQDQRTALQALPVVSKENDYRLVKLMQASVTRLAIPYWRSVAEARSLVVALACERYRLKKSYWPEKLTDIPREILAAIPLDPYDGQPIRYQVLKDGIAVYSIGANLKDDGGEIANPSKPHGKDEGVRLWDPMERGK